MKQYKINLNHTNLVNLFIVYELDTWSRDKSTDFASSDCLSGAVTLSKNADPNKYGYSGYIIGLDGLSIFSLSNNEWSKNVAIFGVKNISSMYADNREKDTLVLGKGPVGRLDDTAITAEDRYTGNISRPKKVLH